MTDEYSPSFSMPTATSFCPGQCAPTTCRAPPCAAERLPCRPSVTQPPRLIVKCCPESIQPLSKWLCWMERARSYACAWLRSVLFGVAVWCTSTRVGRVARTVTASRAGCAFHASQEATGGTVTASAPTSFAGASGGPTFTPHAASRASPPSAMPARRTSRLEVM